MRKKKINLDNLSEMELQEYNRLLNDHRLEEIRNDRNLFTEHILKDRISKEKVRQSAIHKAMQYAFEHFTKVLVIVPRNSGKCFVGGSMVSMSNGGFKRIEDFVGGEKIISLNDDEYKFEEDSVLGLIKNGDKLVYKIRTRMGYTNTVTENHPFKSVTGYVKLKDVVVGDKIAVSNKIIVKRAAVLDKNKKILKIINGDIVWDSVVYVEKVGVLPTYGIEVKKNHNHIVDGIISHNTSQSMAAMLYEIGKNKNIIIKIISDGDDTASKRVNAIKQHLEHNKDFLELYSDIKPLTLGNNSLARENWGKTSLTIKRDIIDLNATVSGSSITTRGVGDRADLLVFDDPCNLRNSILMPALREQVIDAYYSVWLPLLNESGRVWYFGTPYSSDDLGSLLREKWKNEPDCCVLDFHVGQKIEVTSEGKVLSLTETDNDTLPIWPENFSQEFYRTLKRTMTKKAYARAYLCRAISDSDIFFKMVDIQASLDYSFEMLENIDELEPVD